MFVDPCIIVQFIKKNPTRCNSVSKFYHLLFIWSSTCFGRHTAHHQALRTALAASGFHTRKDVRRVYGATCAGQRPPTTRPTTFHVWKTRGRQCSFKLLMMGGVSPETCWASYKWRIIKSWYIVASCWIFLYELQTFSIPVYGLDEIFINQSLKGGGSITIFSASRSESFIMLFIQEETAYNVAILLHHSDN
jgi:hypothetical protein